MAAAFARERPDALFLILLLAETDTFHVAGDRALREPIDPFAADENAGVLPMAMDPLVRPGDWKSGIGAAAF